MNNENHIITSYKINGMITYNLFTISDLKKFLETFSYQLKERLTTLIGSNIKTPNIETEKLLTDRIISFKNDYVQEMKNDVTKQISDKNDYINKLKNEIVLLQFISDRIEDKKSFKEIFETIVNE